jgi:hypothetical protein
MTDNVLVQQFTATKWDSAADKAAWLDNFVRFAKRGSPRTMFTKKLYKRLSMMFFFIAHYNIEGFYEEKFSTAGRRQQFWSDVREYHPVGDPAYTWSDVERAIQRWLAEHPEIR